MCVVPLADAPLYCPPTCGEEIVAVKYLQRCQVCRGGAGSRASGKGGEWMWKAIVGKERRGQDNEQKGIRVGVKDLPIPPLSVWPTARKDNRKRNEVGIVVCYIFL